MILPIRIGQDKNGNMVYKDLAEMPHLLVAGATGSGKSVFLNNVMYSLLTGPDKDNTKLVIVDPKQIEFNKFKNLDNLLFPVIKEPKSAIKALNDVIKIMDSRYKTFSKNEVRSITEFNSKNPKSRMDFIVIIIDEMADLMVVAGKEVEKCIQRLAQLSRAAGIHLIAATQRPSVNVVTGSIKANIPTRISFALPSRHDSMTIIDRAGAEELQGKGDMLFVEMGKPPLRLQGILVNDEDIIQTCSKLSSKLSILTVFRAIFNISTVLVCSFVIPLTWVLIVGIKLLTIAIKATKYIIGAMVMILMPFYVVSKKINK